MSDRLQKKDIVKRLSERTDTDEKRAEAWLDAVTDTLYEAFKEGHSVTLPGFGGFYLKRRGSSCAFKFNPGQKLKALFGWSSTYTGKL